MYKVQWPAVTVIMAVCQLQMVISFIGELRVGVLYILSTFIRNIFINLNVLSSALCIVCLI
jgi:hypothetical protein